MHTYITDHDPGAPWELFSSTLLSFVDLLLQVSDSLNPRQHRLLKDKYIIIISVHSNTQNFLFDLTLCGIWHDYYFLTFQQKLFFSKTHLSSNFPGKNDVRSEVFNVDNMKACQVFHLTQAVIRHGVSYVDRIRVFWKGVCYIWAFPYFISIWQVGAWITDSFFLGTSCLLDFESPILQGIDINFMLWLLQPEVQEIIRTN